MVKILHNEEKLKIRTKNVNSFYKRRENETHCSSLFLAAFSLDYSQHCRNYRL